jgi:hypothetical protein
MPLLLCPNCNESMNAIRRRDVEFDMCPTCRGLWLDRGELEKIIASVQAEAEVAAAPLAAASHPSAYPPQAAPPPAWPAQAPLARR